jgi:glycosyltransferase involved in cell wall biosynthesis
VQRYGGDIAVRALACLDGEVPGAEFFIYGDGDFAEHIADEISRHGLSERVRMSDGMLPLEAVAPALGDAKVGLVPHRDGPIMKWALPTKLMEYIALGIPAVVSRTWAITQYFDDSMVMFFEPGNADDLAHCILKLYRDPDLRRSLARNAQKFLEEHSWEKEREKLFSVIDSL